MFFAPFSALVTKCAARCRLPMPGPVALVPAGKGLLTLLFFVLLAAIPPSANAQEQPAQFEDLVARAAAAREQGNLPLAIDLYGQAEQLKPDWPEGWFYLGLLQYLSDRYAPAIDAFNHALALQPNSAAVMALRGICEFETGAYDDALRDLDQAVKGGAANEPHNEPIIRTHYAELLAHAGRFQLALIQYRTLASKQVDDPDLRLGVGLAGMQSTTLPEDVAHGDRELYTAVGNAGYAFLSDDSQTADTLFSKLFEQYPTTPGLHFFYGTLLSMRGAELAIPQFQGEVAIAPSNVQAHALLAFWLMFAGRFAEARPEAELAVAAAPNLEVARITFARSLAETGEVERAAELLNQVLKNDPDNLEAHLGLAVVYARSGRREDAYHERMVCLGLEK
jgi:tetratricopeptide (TPR) repeat protein